MFQEEECIGYVLLKEHNHRHYVATEVIVNGIQEFQTNTIILTIEVSVNILGPSNFVDPALVDLLLNT